MDSVNFWGVFGGLAAALGVVPGTVGVAVVSPKWSGLLSNVWFEIAIACWAVGSGRQGAPPQPPRPAGVVKYDGYLAVC